MIFLPGSPQPYAHQPRSIRGLSGGGRSSSGYPAEGSPSRRGVYEGAAARLEHAMSSAFEPPDTGEMRLNVPAPGSIWAAAPGSLTPQRQSATASAATYYGSAFGPGSPSHGGRGPSPHGVLVPYGVLRQPRSAAASSKRRSTRGNSGSAQRPSPAQAAQQAYVNQGRKPAGRPGVGPRARFPSNFPQRIADGSTGNAQVFTLGREGPPDLDGQMAGPAFGSALPHAEVSEPSHQLATAYEREPPPRQHGAQAARRQPASSRGWTASPAMAGGGVAAARRAGMPAAFNSAFNSPCGSPSAGSGGASDFRSAMAELDSLRLAAVDPRDEQRYARPQTAAGSIGGGWVGAAAGLGAARSAGGASVSPTAGGAAGGATGDEESAEDLKLRLSAAEAVMRKLYRRNNQLEEEARQKESLPQRPQTATARSTRETQAEDSDHAAPPAGDPADPLAGADEQALFLLQQKESDLQQMRDYTAQLQERLQSVAALQKETGHAQPGAATSDRAEAATAQYRDRYLRMRNDYRSLLKSRVGSIKKSTIMGRQSEQAVLLTQLDSALQEEADLHRRESQRLNEELYRQEKQSCDWHVERRILETRLAQMEGSIQQRDEIDGAIESKMAALFSRLQQLETTNLQLEQSNEELKSKVTPGGNTGAVGVADGAAGDGGRCGMNILEAEPGGGQVEPASYEEERMAGGPAAGGAMDRPAAPCVAAHSPAGL